MGRKNRGEVFKPDEVGVYHCIQRVVRRAWLCGVDKLTGKSFEHRRTWVESRLEELAAVFAFDCLSYAIMSNHLHLITRNRPDILQGWSGQEVAERWWRLCPGRREQDGRASEPTGKDLKPLLQKKRNQQLRARLGSISWLMRYLAEPIARRANKEDECTGRFWEGRFKSQSLIDESAILACSTYVDLNPIRAGMSTTPAESLYTSAHRRILAEQMRAGASPLQHTEQDVCGDPHSDVPGTNDRATDAPGKQAMGRADDWLAPVSLDARAVAYEGAMPSTSGSRASDKGFLSMSLAAYLELLDWTGRRLRQEEAPAAIPPSIAPMLEKTGLTADSWCDLVGRFGRIFKQAAGAPISLAQEAARRGQRWLQTSKSPLTDIAS